MSPAPRRALRRSRVRSLAAVVVSIGCAACASAPKGTSGPVQDEVAASPADAGATDLIPPGYGTLRQEDIAVRMQAQGVLVRAIPLDESVIRVLSPDSYRALRDLAQSRRAQIESAARRAAVERYRLWYVSFYGVEPDARFSPAELVLTSAGRDFRPRDILPLSSGFGQQRLAQREIQSAIYLFDEGVDVNQPITVTMETTRNTDWQTIIQRIERERALVRSRAAGHAR